ncbi:hypothetical protein BGX28_002929 [Mortierella sp. GBA30]|nr:hypothetical protein BGX28_002929 [Mortierella sp. GBA30]
MKITFSSLINITAIALMTLLASTFQIDALPRDHKFQKRAIAGLNNYDCKLTPAHPRPLLLVHATLLTLDSWWTFAPAMINEGYCVFALTYGKYREIPVFGGMAPVEDSAQELAKFANNVLTKMNTTQLDYVGHSQGGILGRYWIKHLDGAGKVHRMIGISSVTHGTTFNGLTNLAKSLRIFDPAQPYFDTFAPSFYQMVDNSEFMQKLNNGGDVAPGVIHSNIATKYDEVVTPYQTCFQYDAAVTNVLLQDLCSMSMNEHLTMINSKVVLRFVLNQLDPDNAKTANCLSVF